MPHADPEVRRAYMAEYRMKNHDRIRERINAWRREHYAQDPEYKAKMRERARATPPAVHAAHMRVYKAIKRGEITRPDTCSRCGRSGFIEASHRSYGERLDIEWLCRRCHRLEDHDRPKVIDATAYVAPQKTHCKHGHEYTPENTYERPDGKGRDCRICRAAAGMRRGSRGRAHEDFTDA